MNEKESKIRNLVEELIENKDIASLDVLFTLAFGDYHAIEKNQLLIKSSLRKIAEHNLEAKYNRKPGWCKSKLRVVSRLEEECDFYQDFWLLQDVLIKKAKDSYQNDVNDRIKQLGSIEKDVLGFILAFILYSLDVEEEEHRSGIFTGRGFYVDHDHFSRSYNLEQETLTFNILFDKKLRRSKEILVPKKSPFGRIQQELYPYEIGDIAVKSGMAFWCPWVTNAGNVHLHFIIPKFLYAIVKQNKETLPKIEDFKNKVEVIREQLEGVNIQKKYPYLRQQRRTYYIDADIQNKNHFDEENIENTIAADPELLEGGLKLIERQKTTDAGIIDLLCQDKEDNYVIIELKKNNASDKVVGQIQRYMAWVEENLADRENVRGLIVAQGHDRKLEYAIKGSKYPIEMKVFGEEAPVEENIKYCDKCGEANRKSAKFCVRCGNKFWME